MVWDVKTGKGAKLLWGLRGPLGGVSFSPDGRILVARSRHGDILFWDVATWRPLKKVTERGTFKVCEPMSLNPWPVTEEFPSGYLIEGHAYLQKWGVGGSYGPQASIGCCRSCFNYLEKHNLVEQTFAGGDFTKRPPCPM